MGSEMCIRDRTSSDPIADQQRAQKAAGRSIRFDRLAPPRINLPDDNGSTSELAVNPESRRKSYGALDVESKPTSRASSVSPDSRGVGRAHDKRMDGFRSGRQRHWSISDRLRPEQASKVTMRDVARVRALLLSSGVKAREIQRLANTPRNQPLPVMEGATNAVGQELGSVPRKEEHIRVSKMLSDHLSSLLSAFEKTIKDFQSGPATSLSSRVDELQRKAADHLTTIVHETSDDADAFVVELTTKQPQDIKRVDDAIDEMLRQRRRQFRLLRRTGFKLLEWMLLGIMWWVWFIVVLFKSVRKMVVGFWSFLRWLLLF